MLLCRYRYLSKSNDFSKPFKQLPGYWDKRENISNFLKNIADKLNLKTPQDWNSITQNQIRTLGGNRLLNKLSIFEIKCLGCPEGKSKFLHETKRKSSGYWENKENINKFLSILKQKLDLKTPFDWNLIKQDQIRNYGGSRLLSKYSLFEIKNMACPEGKSLFENQPNRKLPGYWDNQENIIFFLDKLKKKLNLVTAEDWNSLSAKQIIENGGSSLIYKYSLFEIKCFGFPEGKNYFSKPKKQNLDVNDTDTIKILLENIRNTYQLKTIDDWNTITCKQIKVLQGGAKLLNKYSLYQIKCLGFPDGKYMFNKPKKPSGYWDIQENIENFLEKFRIQHNLNNKEDWNSVTQNQITQFGGGTLFRKYSLYDIKCLGYPDGKGYFNLPIQYKSVDYWDRFDNIQNFINQLKMKLNLSNNEDWNRISKAQILHYGGWGFLSKLYNNDFSDDIKSKIPEISFIKVQNKTRSGKGRSSQRWLFLQIQQIYSKEEIVEDYYHSEISRLTGFPIQFDIYLVHKKIAIEYHGKQHYEDIPTGFAPLELYKARDEEKKKLCSKFGIKLIIIPYWWDNKLNSLRETIEKNLQM